MSSIPRVVDESGFRVTVLVIGMFVFCLGFPARGKAQSTGSIEGTASDASGAAISSATVTLSCDCKDDCGVTPPCPTCCPLSSAVSVTTDDSGRFRFSNIPVGTYTLTGEAPGFAKTTQTGVRVSLTQMTEVNLEFRPGNIGATVEVTSGGTATASTQPKLIGTVIDDVSRRPVANATVIVSRRTCDCRRECQKTQPCDSCCPYVRDDSISTNEKGEFTIDVRPGDYNFRIATGAITKDHQRKVTSKATQRIKIHVDLPAGGAKQ